MVPLLSPCLGCTPDMLIIKVPSLLKNFKALHSVFFAIVLDFGKEKLPRLLGKAAHVGGWLEAACPARLPSDGPPFHAVCLATVSCQLLWLSPCVSFPPILNFGCHMAQVFCGTPRSIETAMSTVFEDEIRSNLVNYHLPLCGSGDIRWAAMHRQLMYQQIHYAAHCQYDTAVTHER